MTLKSASLVFRYTGIVLLALAVGTSTLTFSWLFGEPSDPRIFREFAAPVIYLSDLFSLVGLALWTVSWVLRGRPTLRLGPSYISVPMAVLAVAGLFSALWAIDSRIALLNGLRLGGLFVMYFVFVNEYRRATPIVAAVLITLGVLHAVVAVAQIVNDAPLGLTTLGEIVDNAALNSYLKLGGRPSGLGFNPNPVGMLMGIGSVLSFAAFLLIRRSVLGRLSHFHGGTRRNKITLGNRGLGYRHDRCCVLRMALRADEPTNAAPEHPSSCSSSRSHTNGVGSGFV